MSDPALNDLLKPETKEETPQAESEQPTPASDEPLTTLLMSIKNEEGQPKYKDVPTALDALKHSQDYITQLKNKVNELEGKVSLTETELGKQTAVTDFVDQLKTSLEPQAAPEPTPQVQAGLTEEDFDRLLAEREAKRKSQSNVETVVTALKTSHGDKASEYLETKATELGMSVESLTQLASTSPQAALTLLGNTGSQPRPSVPSSTVNTGSLNLQAPSSEAPRPPVSMMRGVKTKDMNDYMQSLIDHHYRNN